MGDDDEVLDPSYENNPVYQANVDAAFSQGLAEADPSFVYTPPPGLVAPSSQRNSDVDAAAQSAIEANNVLKQQTIDANQRLANPVTLSAYQASPGYEMTSPIAMLASADTTLASLAGMSEMEVYNLVGGSEFSKEKVDAALAQISYAKTNPDKVFVGAFPSAEKMALNKPDYTKAQTNIPAALAQAETKLLTLKQTIAAKEAKLSPDLMAFIGSTSNDATIKLAGDIGYDDVKPDAIGKLAKSVAVGQDTLKAAIADPSKSAADVNLQFATVSQSVQNTMEAMAAKEIPTLGGIWLEDGLTGHGKLNLPMALAALASGMSLYQSLYQTPKQREEDRKFQLYLRELDFERQKEMLSLKFEGEEGLIAARETAKKGTPPAANPAVRL